MVEYNRRTWASRKAGVYKARSERIKTDEEFRLRSRRDRAKSQSKAWRIRNKWIAEARSKGCSRCSEKHPATLDFHHIDLSTKEFTIGEARNRKLSEARFKAELAKCIVLCANCHRKEHYTKAFVGTEFYEEFPNALENVATIPAPALDIPATTAILAVNKED
jgi:hypothetical protein